MSKKKTYLHGFSSVEQDRLYQQARFLESEVFKNINFSKVRNILEVGCGVGAQTEILLERFPHLNIQGIDLSEKQVGQAHKRLKKPISQGKVKLDVGNAAKLPYSNHTFEGAFCSWFLEHVQDPVGILKEIKRVLKPGSTLYCAAEPMNATFFVHPYSPATLKVWFEENDYQWELKGDPFSGAKLANYLLKAGYKQVSTEVKVDHFDNRMPKERAEHIEYWTNLLLSAAPDVVKAGKITKAEVKSMKEELARLKHDPDAVFFISWVQAKARA
jgi:ubiquinone/menaquinone biosynthesis C-methylase UbiE